MSLVRFANRTGQELVRKHDWTVLQASYSFPTVNGVSAYALPDDFDRFIVNTGWGTGQRWPLVGPQSPQEWEQVAKSSVGVSQFQNRYRIQGATASRFQLQPTPGSVETISFEYIANTWVRPAGGNPNGSDDKDSFTADGDTSLLPESLIEFGVKYRFLRSAGFDYSEERDEFERALGRAMSQDGGAPVLTLGHRQGYGRLLNGMNVPDGDWG